MISMRLDKHEENMRRLEMARLSEAGLFVKQVEKYNEAACAGWTVLRVTGSMVHDGRALEYVRRALALI